MAYNKNTDYQELINKAVANKDYVSAAKYEQQRNEKIAAANADGTNVWNAAPTSNYSNWLNYTGSANAVGTNSQEQAAIKAQMNANAQAWHGATKEAQDSLHAQNEYLASLLGGTVGYDEKTGYWTGDAEKKQGVSQDVSDLSSYINDMYSAQKKAALAELETAYRNNLAAIDRADAGLSDVYQKARNQAVGASELAKRNNAEYAAAYGLNSGTGGQMDLARSTALQSNLNDISMQEAQSAADLELQRTTAEINYNDAIAQAEAQGDYELAGALYQEKIRVQEALLQRQVQQAQMEYQSYRDSVEDSRWQQTFEYNADQASKTAGSKDSGGDGYKPVLTYSQVMKAVADGAVTPVVKADFAYYNGVSYDDYLESLKGPEPIGSKSYIQVRKAAMNLADANYSDAEIVKYLQGRVANGYITEEEAERITGEIMGA